MNSGRSKRQTSATMLKNIVQPLATWFISHARDLPWRRTRDPYAIWVSEIMLQQTQVKTVIPFFERWMRELPTIESLANVSPDRLHKLWEGLGYYTRVRNMQRAALLMVAGHSSQFPRTFEQVLELPGIGRYTAGAICSIAFNKPTPIVDGNVVRVVTRLFGIKKNAREKDTLNELWAIAGEMVQAAAMVEPLERHDGKIRLSGSCSAFNQGLMELGATICTPREPKCEECPLRRACVARRESVADQLPNLGQRVAATQRRFIAAVVQRDGRVLVRQRPAGVVNAHLWEFPNVEIPLGARKVSVKRALEEELGCGFDALEPLGTIRHSITRYRIAMEVVRAELDGAQPAARAGEWRSRQEVDALAFTSAHRRVAKHWLVEMTK
jgi:A/G-specific adenine glycosylase